MPDWLLPVLGIAGSALVSWGYHTFTVKDHSRRIILLEEHKDGLMAKLEDKFAQKEMVQAQLDHLAGSVGGVHRVVDEIAKDVKYTNRTVGNVLVELARLSPIKCDENS